MKPSEILVKAKKLIATEQTWCQGLLAMNKYRETNPRAKDAIAWCAIGAVQKISRAYKPLDYISDIVEEEGWNSVDALNDETDHATVMWMFSKAIKKARKDEQKKALKSKQK